VIIPFGFVCGTSGPGVVVVSGLLFCGFLSDATSSAACANAFILNRLGIIVSVNAAMIMPAIAAAATAASAAVVRLQTRLLLLTLQKFPFGLQQWDQPNLFLFFIIIMFKRSTRLLHIESGNGDTMSNLVIKSLEETILNACPAFTRTSELIELCIFNVRFFFHYLSV
jgi:hypothetical protein